MPAEEDVTDAVAPDTANSVRPPDLAPDQVRTADDVLSGWDTDAEAADLARWQLDRPPFPTDTVVVVGAKVLGAAIGATLDRRRGRGFVLGAAAGLTVAVVARQLWRLDV
ncbi:MAG: hypothetical protein WD378_10620 [Egicoccus sp.]